MLKNAQFRPFKLNYDSVGHNLDFLLSYYDLVCHYDIKKIKIIIMS